MKNHQYPVEHFEDFQNKKGSNEDILYFKTKSAIQRKDPIGLDFFSFLLFETGSGTHTIDDVVYEIQSKQLHLIFPGQLHSWDILAGSKVHTVFVSAKLFRLFENFFIYPIDFYKKNPVFELSSQIYRELLVEFKGIDRELAHAEGMREIIYSKFRVISLMFNRLVLHGSKQIGDSKSGPLLTRFSLLLLAFSREQRTVKFYAERTGVSANYLNILCQRYFEMNANAFISKEVINVIIIELLSAGRTVKEIAMEFNFNDLSGFSNYFKRHTGLSPRDFLSLQE
ncbi:HTH-type transcriptional activator RhaR [compost metagenome]